MLSENQMKMTDALLKHLREKGGKTTIDNYTEAITALGFDDFDLDILVEILIYHLGLLVYLGSDKYWITLTPKGNTAAKIGIYTYIKEIEQKEELDKRAKECTIDGVNAAKKDAYNSKRMSILALIFSVIVPFLVIMFDKKINSPEPDSKTHRDNGQYNGDSVVPHFGADSALIEVIKDSLIHDTLFLDELQKKIE